MEVKILFFFFTPQRLGFALLSPITATNTNLSECKRIGRDWSELDSKTWGVLACVCVCLFGGWRVVWKGFGQSGNESVTLCKNIWFPCRKKKSMSESRMQSGGFVQQRLLWQWFPSSPFIFTGGWKGHVNPPPLPTSPFPTSMRAYDPSWFIFLNRIHCERGKGEEVLLCSALSVSPIISRTENVEEHTDWPRSLGKSTLHNVNCTSATITFLY